jgi:hypothetical protein
MRAMGQSSRRRLKRSRLPNRQRNNSSRNNSSNSSRSSLNSSSSPVSNRSNQSSRSSRPQRVQTCHSNSTNSRRIRIRMQVPHAPISHILSRGRNPPRRMCRPAQRLRKALNRMRPSPPPPPRRVSRAHRNQSSSSSSSSSKVVLEQVAGMRMVISAEAGEAGDASFIRDKKNEARIFEYPFLY